MKIYILRIKTATRNLACSQRQGCVCGVGGGGGGSGVLISAFSVPTYGTGSKRTSVLKLSY